MMYNFTCPFCGTVTTLHLSPKAVALRESGALCQVAFPDLTSAEREVIISGVCFKCQDGIFEDEED